MAAVDVRDAVVLAIKSGRAECCGLSFEAERSGPFVAVLVKGRGKAQVYVLTPEASIEELAEEIEKNFGLVAA